MNQCIDIHKSAGILIKNRKLLITRSKGKDFFIAPGGKIENKETSQEALARELDEELKVKISLDDIKLMGVFYATAAGNNNKYLQMDVYFVNEWEGNIYPNSEVEETKWIDSSFLNKIELGSIFEHEVIPKLKSLGLID